jgi:hypothetical protein
MTGGELDAERIEAEDFGLPGQGIFLFLIERFNVHGNA